MRPTLKTVPAKVIEFHANLSGSGEVDKINGIVRGVSLITGGIKARGHDLEVDDKTLTQVHALATAMGQVPVKWNHKTGADAVNGYVTEFRIEANKVKGDWHLLKTHAQYEQALELAERMPQNIGLSAAFLGKEEKVGGVNKARCEELISVDLVAQPAANPDGLFEAGVDTGANRKLMETPAAAAAAPATEPTLADLFKLVQGQGESLKKVTDRLDQYDAEAGEDDGLTPEQLAQIAAMTDEELAPLGVTREQVEAAVADAQSQGIEIPGQDEGPFAARGDFAHNNTPATVEAVGAELADLRKHIVRLERKEAVENEKAEAEKIEHAFEVIEKKVTALAAENDALRHCLETGADKAVTPGGEIIEFSRPEVTPGPAKKAQTEFEARVDAIVAADTSTKSDTAKKTAAILFAQKENPVRYTKHLEAIGVGIKHL